MRYETMLYNVTHALKECDFNGSGYLGHDDCRAMAEAVLVRLDPDQAHQAARVAAVQERIDRLDAVVARWTPPPPGNRRDRAAATVMALRAADKAQGMRDALRLMTTDQEKP